MSLFPVFRRAGVAVLLAGLSLAGPAFLPASPAAGGGDNGFAYSATPGTAQGDFNRDGFADLAIGVPGEEVAGFGAAGAVNVIYGSPIGVNAGPTAVRPDQLLVQTSDLEDPDDLGPTSADVFGQALAVGDFNGDSFGDLAVGAPGDEVGGIETGSVSVFFGSQTGLVGSSSQFIAGPNPDGQDAFGFVLAAGDFDGDGLDDLAVSNWFGRVTAADATANDQGEVFLFPGTPLELGESPGEVAVLSQDSPGTEDAPELADRFGFSLATGDANGDKLADLAVGVPAEDLAVLGAGAVHVFFGCNPPVPTCRLVDTATDQFLHEDTSGVKGEAEPGGVSNGSEEFGTAVAMGDFGESSAADLAVGTPGQDVDGVIDAGAVTVLYGSKEKKRLSTSGEKIFDQNTSGIRDEAEEFDGFGGVLAAGNVGRDRRADLAVGIRLEDVGSVVDAGAVAILYGRSSGLDAKYNEFFHQDTLGVVDTAEFDDRFGSSVAIADFGRSTVGDVAVAASREDLFIPAFVENAGAVHVFYGDNDADNDGVSVGKSHYFVQGVAGDDVEGVSEPFDSFGGTLDGLAG